MFKRVILSLALISSLFPNLAHAGKRVSEPVSIRAQYLPTRPGVILGYNVSGSLGTVRNSTDTVQDIGCAVSYGTSSHLKCWAVSLSGTEISCTSTNLEMARALSSLNSNSILKFSTSAPIGYTALTCTWVQVTNASSNEPAER